MAVEVVGLEGEVVVVVVGNPRRRVRLLRLMLLRVRGMVMALLVLMVWVGRCRGDEVSWLAVVWLMVCLVEQKIMGSLAGCGRRLGIGFICFESVFFVLFCFLLASWVSDRSSYCF